MLDPEVSSIVISSRLVLKFTFREDEKELDLTASRTPPARDLRSFL